MEQISVKQALKEYGESNLLSIENIREMARGVLDGRELTDDELYKVIDWLQIWHKQYLFDSIDHTFPEYQLSYRRVSS
jgi:hypothetical protein